MFNDDFIMKGPLPEKKEQPIEPGKFVRFADIYNYIKASALAYLSKDDIIQYSTTLLPPDLEFVDFKYIRYRQIGHSKAAHASASVVDSASDSWAYFFGDNRTNFLEFESKERKETIIALRGTVVSDFKDVADDFHIAQSVFFPISTQLDIEVTQILLESNKKGYKTVFTGHSLGGYIASRLALKHKQKAIVFDAPGIESISVPKGKLEDWDIHCFVSSPNFFNCVGIRVGKLYHIPYIETKDTPTILEDAYQGIEIKTEENTIEPANSYVKKVISGCAKWFFCRSISSLFHLDHQTVENSLNTFLDVTSQVSNTIKKSSGKVLEAADSKYSLKEKWGHTLQSHSIEMMLSSVLYTQHQLIKRLDKWPDLKSFLTAELKLLKKEFSFVEEVPAVTTSTNIPLSEPTKVSVTVSSPTPSPVSEPLRQLPVDKILSDNEHLPQISKKRKPMQIAKKPLSTYDAHKIKKMEQVPEKKVIPDSKPLTTSGDLRNFLLKRSVLYFFIVTIVLLFCKLTDSLDKTNMAKGMFLSVILVELLLKFKLVSEKNTFITTLFAPTQKADKRKKNSETQTFSYSK